MRRLLALYLIVLSAAAMPPHRAGAQEATPAAFPLTPDPVECRVEPPQLGDLQMLVATPAAMRGEQASASPTPFAMPEGEPADEATRAEVLAVLREAVACINAGDYPRLFAFYGPNVIRRFVEEGLQLEQVFTIPVQELAPAQRTVIIEVQEVRLLPDGRVAALIIGDDPTNENPAGPTLFFFARIGDRWLIDEFVQIGTAGTPTAG